MTATNYTWKIYIDFDRDGDFEAGDEITDYVMGAEWNNGMREAFQLTADESRLTLTLNNEDKRFSPEYASGPHYGNLVPQRKVKVEGIYSGGTKTMYTGWVDVYEPTLGETGERACVVTCTGAKQFLAKSEVYLDLMQDVTADEVLGAIMGQVIFPPVLGGGWVLGIAGLSELGASTYLADTGSLFNFEEGVNTFPYVGDTWANGLDAYSAIERLMRSERGRFYFDRAGSAVFLNRRNFQSHHLNDGTVDNYMAGARYDYGAEVHNVVRVTCSPRQITAGSVTLWTLDKPIALAAGETKPIRARYMDDSGAQIGGVNVSYTGVSASSGISLTSLDAQARSAELIFTNSSSTPGFVNAVTVIGQKITTFNQLTIEEIDNNSAAEFGRRALELNCDLLDDEADARGVAQFELQRRKDPRGMMRNILMQERTPNNSSQMFNLTIANRIRAIEDQTAHAADYFIVGEEWRLGKALTTAEVTWQLEPASTVAFWLLQVPGYGELNDTTYLGF